MRQTIKQFERAATVLRAFPPKITSNLTRPVKGEMCHCALGTLGIHAGVPVETLNYDTIREPLRKAYGIDTTAFIIESDIVRMEVGSVVYGANDDISEDEGTPEERAEHVIAEIAKRIYGKEQTTRFGVPV